MKQFKFFAIIFAMTAVFASCTGSSSDESEESKYLAVRLEGSEEWSIIDEDGNIVVRDAFESRADISPISSGGAFWVERDKKLQLYSISSSKEPLNSTEFDAVESFGNGHACAVCFGQPIQIINEKGKIVTTLSEDIVKAYRFTDGLALVCNSDGKWGYIDTEGNLVIDAQFSDAELFGEGKAVVCRAETPNIAEVIDTKGNVQFTIDLEKYKLDGNVFESSIGRFHEGLLRVWERSSEYAVFLNESGEVAIRLEREYHTVDDCKDGFITARYEGEYGNNICAVYDKTGNMAIPQGKYPVIQNLGRGQFFVIKDFSLLQETFTAGVVDSRGSVVFPFGMRNIETTPGGKSFIVTEEEGCSLQTRSGKVLRKIDGTCEYYSSPTVEYKNDKLVVKKFLAPFINSNFLPLNGETRLGNIVDSLNITTDKTDCKFLRLPSFKVGEKRVDVNAFFDNWSYDYHTDEWFADASLTSVGLFINYKKYEDVDTEKMQQYAIDILKGKGFELDSDKITLNKTIGGRRVRVRVYESKINYGDESSLVIMLWPNFDEERKSPFEDKWFFHLA